jgi:hypothetical protein
MVPDVTSRILLSVTWLSLTYELALGENKKLHWRYTEDGNEIIEDKEPLMSGGKRFQAFLLKIAPEQQR